MPRFFDPEPLGPGHVLGGFDCGVGSLSLWLERHARSAAGAGAGSARSYVVTDRDQGRVVGYHALTVASIEHRDAADPASKGVSRHQVPAVLLARLAVDELVKGRGIGAFLLQDSRASSTARLLAWRPRAWACREGCPANLARSQPGSDCLNRPGLRVVGSGKARTTLALLAIAS